MRSSQACIMSAPARRAGRVEIHRRSCEPDVPGSGCVGRNQALPTSRPGLTRPASPPHRPARRRRARAAHVAGRAGGGGQERAAELLGGGPERRDHRVALARRFRSRPAPLLARRAPGAAARGRRRSARLARGPSDRAGRRDPARVHQRARRAGRAARARARRRARDRRLDGDGRRRPPAPPPGGRAAADHLDPRRSRRCGSAGCGWPASSPRSATPTSPSRSRRPRSCCAPPACAPPRPRPRSCGSAPRGGPRACGSPRSRCARTRSRTASSPSSRATTARSPTTCSPRCSPSSRPTCATSCCASRSSRPPTPSSPTRSPGAPTPAASSTGLERDHALLSSIGGPRAWHRLHPLFAELLRSELRLQRAPARSPSCTAAPRRGSRPTGSRPRPLRHAAPPGLGAGRPRSPARTGCRCCSRASSTRCAACSTGCPRRLAGPTRSWRSPSPARTSTPATTRARARRWFELARDGRDARARRRAATRSTSASRPSGSCAGGCAATSPTPCATRARCSSARGEAAMARRGPRALALANLGIAELWAGDAARGCATSSWRAARRRRRGATGCVVVCARLPRLHSR